MENKKEEKICKNCGEKFFIEPEDFEFYADMKVPPPTFCPSCRLRRQCTWRNERGLYRRICAQSGKNIISIFHPDSSCVVYDKDVWWSDVWDPIEYGQEYDFSKPFFAQFKELLQRVPLPSLFSTFCVNSEYTNHAGHMNNCYLVFASWKCENTHYATQSSDCRDSLDLLALSFGELCYEIFRGIRLYNTSFSEYSENCRDSQFIYDCKNCSNCFCCTSLRNKSYHIFNMPVSEEEYARVKKEWDIGSYQNLLRVIEKYEALKKISVRRAAFLSNTTNTTGDYMARAENCKQCFDMREGMKDCKYCINGGYGMDRIYDTYGGGANIELSAECIDAGISAARLFGDIVVYTGHDVQYSYNCHNSSDCFGCVGVRGKQYCILNKQYTKEEYDALRSKIIAHMTDMPYVDARGVSYGYGEFFPSEISPFAYNESLAQEYFPLSKDEAIQKKFLWRDPERKTYQITKTGDALPDHISDVDDSIVNEVIECAHKGMCAMHQCTQAFRITPQEFALYKRIGVALPRLCPNCRHFDRLTKKNPPMLWERVCACGGEKSKNNIYTNTTAHAHGDGPCIQKFETSYAPYRTEIVYCEECYQSEVI